MDQVFFGGYLKELGGSWVEMVPQVDSIVHPEEGVFKSVTETRSTNKSRGRSRGATSRYVHTSIHTCGSIISPRLNA